MSWNLFIDDQCRELNPSTQKPYRDCSVIDNSRVYVLADTYEEAINLITKNGCPSFISFDHDLGLVNSEESKNGYDLAKFIVDLDLDLQGKFIPYNFDFQVHSKNPIGAKNIITYLSNYLKSKKN
jgi:hypothetical protein